MKRAAVIFTGVLLAACIAVSAAYNTPKRRTLRFFYSHHDTLISDIAHSTEGQPASSLDITFNYWAGEHPIVEYIVVRAGLVPSSRYYGFFYSYDGTPVSFQNSGEKLVPVSSDEWEWYGRGDNRGTVLALGDNWFYFEACF